MRPALLITLCAGMFLVQLDVTVVTVALPVLGGGLGAGVGELQWVVDGYSVVLAALVLTGGALGDVLGHRGVVLAGLAVFGAASVACGCAPSVVVLVVARGVQGVGAALLLPGTLAVINHECPEPRARAQALGVWAGVSALALPAGPLLGGALVAVAGWRPVFLINAPIVAVAAFAVRRLVARGVRKPGRVDVPGAATAALALGAGVYAVIAHQLLAAVPAGLAAAAFVLVEHRSVDPMLPLGLLRSRRTAGANAISAAMNFAGLGTVLVVTLHLQRVLNFPPLEAGLAMLPLFLPLAVLGPLSGRLTAKFGPRPQIVAGLVVGALGLFALLHADATGYAAVLPALLGLGVGMGLLTAAVVTAAVVTAAVDGAPPARAGIAGGVNNAARQAGGALGVAVFGAVAGDPARTGAFVHGLHVLGVAAGALWLAAAVLALRTT